MTFGEKLQRLRRREGLSQEQLAASLGVSRQAVSKWELGEAVPGTENVVEISRLFGVGTDDLLLAERDLPPAAPPPAAEQAPAARPNRALLVAGVCLAALGGLGDLVLWVLSTMVESDLPATSMDGLGRIWYTTQRGYAFWPFIEEHRLQAVLGLCTLSLLAGAVLLGAFLWRGRRARGGRVQPGRLRRRYWNRKERGRDLPNGGPPSLWRSGGGTFSAVAGRAARGATRRRGGRAFRPLCSHLSWEEKCPRRPSPLSALSLFSGAGMRRAESLFFPLRARHGPGGRSCLRPSRPDGHPWPSGPLDGGSGAVSPLSGGQYSPLR